MCMCHVCVVGGWHELKSNFHILALQLRYRVVTYLFIDPLRTSSSSRYVPWQSNLFTEPLLGFAEVALADMPSVLPEQ